MPSTAVIVWHLASALSQLSYDQFRVTFDRLSHGYDTELEDGNVVYRYMDGIAFLQVPLEDMAPPARYRHLANA